MCAVLLVDLVSSLHVAGTLHAAFQPLVDDVFDPALSGTARAASTQLNGARERFVVPAARRVQAVIDGALGAGELLRQLFLAEDSHGARQWGRDAPGIGVLRMVRVG